MNFELNNLNPALENRHANVISSKETEWYGYRISEAQDTKRRFMDIRMYKKGRFPKIPKDIYSLHISNILCYEDISIPKSVKYLVLSHLLSSKESELLYKKIPSGLHGLGLNIFSKKDSTRVTHDLSFIKKLKLLVLYSDDSSKLNHFIFPEKIKYLEIYSKDAFCKIPKSIPLSIVSLKISGSCTGIEDIGRFKKLIDIEIKCELNNLPKLPNKLQYIDLSWNNLKKIPESLKDLRSLRYLNLFHNDISDNDSLSFLKKLRLLEYLSLSSNSLSGKLKLDLPYIKHLNIAFNKIEQVDIKDCKNLKSLVLLGNSISEIKNIHKAPGIVSIDISRNPIKEIKGVLPVSLKKIVS